MEWGFFSSGLTTGQVFSGLVSGALVSGGVVSGAVVSGALVSEESVSGVSVSGAVVSVVVSVVGSVSSAANALILIEDVSSKAAKIKVNVLLIWYFPFFFT